MNNSRTTKDAIILKIREIVARDGLNALSIRGLAKELDSSVGIIYYYFPSNINSPLLEQILVIALCINNKIFIIL